MKEDHMLNGQLKLAYNVQIAVENYFIPASNEPSTVLARVFGECREGQIPRSSAALQVGCPVSLLRGI